MLYRNVFLGIQDIILSIIVLTIFILVIIFIYFFIKKEKFKNNRDKYMLINDVVKYDKLCQLINYRIDNNKDELYFSLMLINIDQFNQIKDLVSEDGIREFIYKIITFIRMNLPKGAKMAQLDHQDTFLVYLPEIYEEKDFFKLGEAFKTSIEKKITVSKTINIKKTASLSLAYYPHDGDTYEEIYSNLNKALINVKKFGGNAIALYQEDMKKNDNYYNAYLQLDKSIDNGNLFVENRDIYNPNINMKIGSSSYLYLKEKENLLTFRELMKPLREFNDDLWIGLYYFEKSITNNINILQEIGAKPFYIFIENSIQTYEYSDLFGNYIDLINKYKIDASKFIFTIIDEIDIEKNQKAIKNILNLIDVGFKFSIEMVDISDKKQKLLEIIDFQIIKIDVRNISKEMIDNLKEKTIFVYNVNTIEEDLLVKELNVEMVEGNFYHYK